MFCNINDKNIITNLSKENMIALDLHIASYDNYNPPTDSSITKYFKQIMLKNTSDTFTSSLSLCKFNTTKQTITKSELKVVLTFLESSSSFQGDLFPFTQENVESLGKMLMYSYEKIISKPHIKSINSFNTAYEAVINDRINIKHKHKEYLKSNGNISYISFLKVFNDNKANSGYLPAEMIYIINIMKKIAKLKFELVNYDQVTFDYFLLILLNAKWIFPAFNDIDITLTNDNLLRALHSRYAKDLMIEEIKHNKTIKRINYERGVFFKRQQFDSANNYVNIGEEAFGQGMGINMSSVVDFNSLNSFPYKDKSHFGSIIRMSIISTISNFTAANERHISHYSEIINHYSFSFEFITVLSYFVPQWSHISNLSLSFSEPFEREIQKTVNKKYQIDLRNYHFFNCYFSLNQLRELNIEFNSLDFQIFERVFNLLNANKKLNKLRISLFLSEAHYFPAALFKLYQNLEENSKITIRRDNNVHRKVHDNDGIDYMIADHLSSNFNQNIQLLFWELKWLMLDELCIIIQSPNITNSNEKYSMALLKFILNLLLLINSSNCQCETIKIIAPFIQMDARRICDIEDFYEVLDLNKENFNLRSISLQFQLYSIMNVSHLLTVRLHSIYIGDFNPESLHYFIQALNVGVFRKTFKLQIISLGILPVVTRFKYVERALGKLCNLMMPLLSTIEVRSNLWFEGEECKKFFDAINGSFAKNFLFEFNHKAKEVITAMNMNSEALYYYDYYAIVESINEITKSNRELFKRLLRFLMLRKEALITISYS